MRKTVCLMFTTVVALAVPFQAQPRQSAPHEGVIQDMLKALEGMTKVLKTVEDQGTAVAAHGLLKTEVDKFVEARKRAKKLPQPTLDLKIALEKKYKNKLRDAHTKFVFERRRVRLTKGTETVLAILKPLDPPKKKTKGKKSQTS